MKNAMVAIFVGNELVDIMTFNPAKTPEQAIEFIDSVAVTLHRGMGVQDE